MVLNQTIICKNRSHHKNQCPKVNKGKIRWKQYNTYPPFPFLRNKTMKQAVISRFFSAALLLLGTFCGLLLGNSSANEFYQIRGGIPTSLYYFQKDIVGNQYLFFLGDSVLSGTGLKQGDLRYSKQMIDAFHKYFPTAGMHEIRQPYAGGSWFSLYRTSGGQAIFGEMICSGHLAILDFAADDRAVPVDQAKLNVEGLLRQITRYRATHSRIMIYTLTPDFLADYQAGRTPEYIEVCEKLADHYNIPTLNLAKYAAVKIRSGAISFADFSADGINPTDAGAKIYNEILVPFIDDLCSQEIPAAPIRYPLPDPLFPETDDNGRIIAYENDAVVPTGAWKTGQTSPIKPFRHLIVSDNIGDSLTLTFKGSEVGIIDVLETDAPDYELTLDGKPLSVLSGKSNPFGQVPVKKDAPQNNAPSANEQKRNLSDTISPEEAQRDPQMRFVSFARNLDRTAEHKLTLKIATNGTARIGGFLVNGTVENRLAGLSGLERIDAIYSRMDPIRYNGPKDRFDNIPKTMAKLRNGGELRMVLLGDSIMGNTTASQFEQLIMRDYPKCKIVKIASLRSSTGCKYYQDDNRVEDYVLKHNPDLLVIGGISNGSDKAASEAVRSVIKQVRAKQPHVEVLLLTPVFGSPRDAHIKNWTYEIDPTTDNFRFGMQQVAKEENCAFFDMTAPWYQYVLDSGKTLGWFMGDAVHANERGCQIIGRLLEQWFAE